MGLAWRCGGAGPIAPASYQTGYVFWGYQPAAMEKSWNSYSRCSAFAVPYCLVKWFMETAMGCIERRGCLLMVHALAVSH